MSATKSALDKLIKSTSSHWPTLTPKARVELAQLRADLQAAQERNKIMEQANREMSAEVVFLHQRVAEQARQLEKAVEVMNLARAALRFDSIARMRIDNWLAANPAPAAEALPPRTEPRWSRNCTTSGKAATWCSASKSAHTLTCGHWAATRR